MSRATRLNDELMNEHIRLPGFPQIIVTRGWVYQTFKSLGWNESERGYGSLDCTVFMPKAVDDPLTPKEERDYWFGQVREEYRRIGEGAVR